MDYYSIHKHITRLLMLIYMNKFKELMRFWKIAFENLSTCSYDINGTMKIVAAEVPKICF